MMVVIDDTIDGGGVTWSTVVVSVGEGKEMEEREEGEGEGVGGCIGGCERHG